jgi:hypothetical protein
VKDSDAEAAVSAGEAKVSAGEAAVSAGEADTSAHDAGDSIASLNEVGERIARRMRVQSDSMDTLSAQFKKDYRDRRWTRRIQWALIAALIAMVGYLFHARNVSDGRVADIAQLQTQLIADQAQIAATQQASCQTSNAIRSKDVILWDSETELWDAVWAVSPQPTETPQTKAVIGALKVKSDALGALAMSTFQPVNCAPTQ